MNMIFKVATKLAHNRTVIYNLNHVRYSALFINGIKAKDTFVYVSPHIDYCDRISNKEALQDLLRKRKSDVNLEKVENLWTVFEELKNKKEEYDKKRNEVNRELGKLLKTDPDGNQTKQLKIKSDLLKENIKKLKSPFWAAEENAVVEVLKLPNNIHPLTPEVEPKILYTYLEPAVIKKDHLAIGKALDIIHFKKNENYYLKSDAAIFELGSKFFFSDTLKKNNFLQFSNPDFVKSLIIEGCGDDHTNPDSTFILHHNENSKLNIDNRLHLTGGSSLQSFLAYHSKTVVFPKAFPLKYFSMGRQYIPSPSEEDSLFHVSQSSVIQLFCATRESEEINPLLDEIVNILKTIYSQIGCHYRIRCLPADKLQMWESLRLSLEMYSTSLASYVEVGNVSISGDFISKRLLFTYSDKNENKFPHLLSGTILNVPKLLACILEQDSSFSVPKIFQVQS